jgi:hypothetical protein
MNYAKVHAELQRRADLLFAGRYDEIIRHYDFPLALSLQGRVTAITSPVRLWEFLRHLHVSLKARGIVRSEAELVAVELPRDGRFRVWARWHEISAKPNSCGTSDALYYCARTQSGFRTEMLSYSRMSMPELAPLYSSLALSA